MPSPRRQRIDLEHYELLINRLRASRLSSFACNIAVEQAIVRGWVIDVFTEESRFSRDMLVFVHIDPRTPRSVVRAMTTCGESIIIGAFMGEPDNEHGIHTAVWYGPDKETAIAAEHEYGGEYRVSAYQDFQAATGHRDPRGDYTAKHVWVTANGLREAGALGLALMGRGKVQEETWEDDLP